MNIDETVLVNDLIPPFWECPHCGKTNETDEQANDILIEHLVVLRHCADCGYVHCWRLRLTKRFKEKVVNILLNGCVEGKRNDH